MLGNFPNMIQLSPATIFAPYKLDGTFLTLMLFAAFHTHAGDRVEVMLNDPWRADPYTDALEVIEFEQPCLLQLQVMGIEECSRAVG